MRLLFWRKPKVAESIAMCFDCDNFFPESKVIDHRCPRCLVIYEAEKVAEKESNRIAFVGAQIRYIKDHQRTRTILQRNRRH